MKRKGGGGVDRPEDKDGHEAGKEEEEGIYHSSFLCH